MQRAGLDGDAVGQHFDVFLSYARRDAEVVERVARLLKQAGVQPWFDRWALVGGEAWQDAVQAGLDASGACAVFIGGADLGAWESEEAAIALDRAVTQPGFRVIPVLLPGIGEPFDPNRLPHLLRMRQWVDLRRGVADERSIVRLLEAVGAGERAGEVAGGADVVPYRGLRVYEERDAAWYFGREAEVQRLVEKLKAGRFVAVIGPSGSGKSSLARAGVVPALRASGGGDGEGGVRRVVVLRPGNSPLTALAAQLGDLRDATSMQATLAELACDERTLHLCVELALAHEPAGERVVVLVDQLEEIFTLCHAEGERRALLATLLHAATVPGGRVVVIVTLRDDFYGRCAAYPEFAQLISTRQLLLGAMSTDGVRAAIEKPAWRAGLRLEEGLPDTIVADSAAEPGSLPLLEHALLELWRLRHGGVLTLAAYHRTGGVRGALTKRAEATYTAFTPGEREIARRVLLRLTQPGEGTEDTRRRATRTELTPADDGDAGMVDAVIAQLVDARLLTAGRDEHNRDIVDVAHEALIRDWPRLRAWMNADRAGLLTHRRLSDAARDWDQLGREAGALYRGARLGTAQEWAAGHEHALSALERDFLTASQRAEQAERDREHAEQEVALERERRRQRVLRITVGVSLLVAVTVAALGVWALRQRNDALTAGVAARTQAANATSLALASLAPGQLKERPDVSLLLGLAAYESAQRPEASDSVIRALTAIRRSGRTLAILHGHTKTVSGVAFSPDGRTLATGSADTTVRLWDARTHKSLGAPLRHTSGVGQVAFSPDGRTLASASADGTVRLWNPRTHKSLGAPLRGHTGWVFGVAFSPDGRTIATAGEDRTVRLWDTRTHKPLGSLRGHTSGVGRVAFSPDGQTLATASLDTTVRLWDARTHKPLGAPLRGHTTWVFGLAFSPDGRTLATTSYDRTVRLWDARTHKPLGAPLRGHTGWVSGVAFSPDGRTIATASADRTLRLWDARTRKPLGVPLRGHTNGVNGVAFSPDGRTLATTSHDRTAWLWDARTRKPHSVPLRGHANGVNGVAFSPDGRTLATASIDGTARLWDAHTRKALGAPLHNHTGVFGVAFSPDGRTLATASDKGTLRLWDARTHKALGAPLRGHTGRVSGVAFSPDGRTLATSSHGRTVRLWDTRTHKQRGATLRGHTSGVNGVAFSPDGRTLATSSYDETVRLWDARTHKQLGTPLRGHTLWVFGLAFSPDGRTLATASADRTVRLWNPLTHTSLGAPLRGHTGGVNGVAFSPDGRTLATASDDKTVRLWDVRTHKPLGAPLRGHTLGVTGVAFSPDGRTLATASDDRTVRLLSGILWHDRADLRATVCRLLGGGLGKDEWALFVTAIRYRPSCA